MHRRILYFLMIVTLCCTLFAGCGDNNQPDSTTSPTNATTQGTEATDPQNTENLDSIRSTETDETVPLGYVITYSEYIKLTANQQMEIMKQFESKEAFDNWLAEIKQDYEHYMTTVKPIQTVDPKPSTEPTEDAPIISVVPDVTAPQKGEVTFMEYHSMSGEEQIAFINSFESANAFAAWHAAAKKAYEDTFIEIDGTTPINAGDVIGGN